MARAPIPPFEPRSTSYLRPGHFWGIPLDGGHFACGRVLITAAMPELSPEVRLDSRSFVGGLLDWTDAHPPTSESIAGRPLLDYGAMHILAIRDTGSQILGWRDLADDHLTGLRFITWNFGCVHEDGRVLEPPARPLEGESIKHLSTWGRSVIKNLAERHFG